MAHKNATSGADKNTALNKLLKTLTYTAKKRGGKNGDGNTATFCLNPKTPRLYLPADLADNYRSGMVGRTADGVFTLVLKNTTYAGAFTALHRTQHFITVLGDTADVLRNTARTYTLTDKTDVADGVVSYTLTPDNGAKTKTEKR